MRKSGILIFISLFPNNQVNAPVSWLAVQEWAAHGRPQCGARSTAPDAAGVRSRSQGLAAAVPRTAALNALLETSLLAIWSWLFYLPLTQTKKSKHLLR